MQRPDKENWTKHWTLGDTKVQSSRNGGHIVGRDDLSPVKEVWLKPRQSSARNAKSNLESADKNKVVYIAKSILESADKNKVVYIAKSIMESADRIKWSIVLKTLSSLQTE